MDVNNNIIDSNNNNNKNNNNNNNKYLDMYDTDCIGECGEKTNGSQYCCKTYCYKEKYNNDNDNDNDNDNKLPRKKFKKDTSTEEYINKETINLLLDTAWTTIEKLSKVKRPSNWLTTDEFE